MDHLTTLPSELLDIIFTHLNTQDLCRLRGVNHRLNLEINSNASVYSKNIVTREHFRIQEGIKSHLAFEGLTLIQALRVYAGTIGIPPPSPFEIDVHAHRLASWYRASHTGYRRPADGSAWEGSAWEVFAFYFYLHHAFQNRTKYLFRTAGNNILSPRTQQIRSEACTAARTRSLKNSTRLRAVVAETNARSIPSPWQPPDALETAFWALQVTPLAGAFAHNSQQEHSELARISANLEAAYSADLPSAFNIFVSGDPTAALDWALTQKAGLPRSTREFWFAPRPSGRVLFQNALVRVRDFARDPLLISAVWECVVVRPC